MKNNENYYKVMQIFDYILKNKPSVYNVYLTIEKNGNYRINFIKETK